MPASMVYSFVLGSSTEVQVLGPNNKRKAIMFSGPSASVAWLRPTSAGTALTGLPMQANGGPLILTEAEHGDIVKGPWFAIATATLTLGVLETIH